MSWNPSRLPSQRGRTFVVTGGNAGLGYFAAEQLATTGGRVVLASRSATKAGTALASIRARVPDAEVSYLELDLASLDSARRLGDELASWRRLDGLVLNAGMTTGAQRRQVTDDGLELTMQTNFLGHFALTARAWPAIARTPGARVIGLGSLSTQLIALEPDDLLSERRFGFFRAYALSKHAVHGFTFELERRIRAADVDAAAVLAHPGFAVDGLTSPRPGVVASPPPLRERALAAVAQGKNRGAAPIVRALLDPAVRGGDFVGPEHAVKGRPVLVDPAPASASAAFGERLWQRSEEWTHTPFPV